MADPEARRDGDGDGDGSLELSPNLSGGEDPGFIPCGCCLSAPDRSAGQLEKSSGVPALAHPVFPGLLARARVPGKSRLEAGRGQGI